MKKLYYNGSIVTMHGAQTAQSVLTENGCICCVGNLTPADVSDAKPIDLHGAAMLPAFIDAHSHFAAVANGFLQADLSECASFAEIQQAVQKFIQSNHIPAGQWVLGKGYDHNVLREREHPDRAVLDAVAPDNPVVIQHKSGHFGVFNTRALAALNVDIDTPVPDGGDIRQRDGRLTGYMEETAFVSYLKQTPMPGLPALMDAFERAQDKYFSHGIVMAQEGMLAEQLLPVYQAMVQEGRLKIDVVGYPEPESLEPALATFPQAHSGPVRIGGIKIFLDGSPQGRTAWMRAPYADGGDYRGYPTMTDEAVFNAVCTAVRQGVQLLAHCNGDAAAQQMIEAVRRAEAQGMDVAALRPVMIHAQLLDIDQMDAVKTLGIMPSFFVAHVWHWGDVHVENFGMERAARISPAQAALQQGISFTFHQDAPVIEPDMLETVWCAVNRITRTGRILGPDQRISPYDALKAVTLNAAWQYFAEAERGSLEPGKRADFVILDRNPLEVPREQIREIAVLETIRADEPVWKAH